jgi:hypothetical protein
MLVAFGGLTGRVAIPRMVLELKVPSAIDVVPALIMSRDATLSGPSGMVSACCPSGEAYYIVSSPRVIGVSPSPFIIRGPVVCAVIDSPVVGVPIIDLSNESVKDCSALVLLRVPTNSPVGCL